MVGGKQKRVPLDDDLFHTARALGVLTSFR